MLEPGVGVLGEGDMAGFGVDPCTSAEIRLRGREPCLGIGLGLERRRSRPVGVVVFVPCLPTAGWELPDRAEVAVRGCWHVSILQRWRHFVPATCQMQETTAVTRGDQRLVPVPNSPPLTWEFVHILLAAPTGFEPVTLHLEKVVDIWSQRCNSVLPASSCRKLPPRATSCHAVVPTKSPRWSRLWRNEAPPARYCRKAALKTLPRRNPSLRAGPSTPRRHSPTTKCPSKPNR